MRIGIGLPAAVPGTDMTTLGAMGCRQRTRRFRRTWRDRPSRLRQPGSADSAVGRRCAHGTDRPVHNGAQRRLAQDPLLLAKQIASVSRSPVAGS
jgi:hypothetical protein